MTINHEWESQALEQALAAHPYMLQYGPHLAWRALREGGAWMVSYRQQPPPDTPDLWEFQNKVVKTYKRLAGL